MIELRKKEIEERIVRLLHEIVPKSTVIEVRTDVISTAIKSTGNCSLKVEKIESTGWVEESKERFLKSLDSTGYNAMTLKTFYHSIVDRVKAYKAFKTLDIFSLEDVKENAKKSETILSIQEEINSLKKELNKEKRTFKRAEIVKQIKKLMKS